MFEITIKSLESLGFTKHEWVMGKIKMTKCYRVGNVHSNVEHEIERDFIFDENGILRAYSVRRWTWYLAHDPQGYYIGVCTTKDHPYGSFRRRSTER